MPDRQAVGDAQRGKLCRKYGLSAKMCLPTYQSAKITQVISPAHRSRDNNDRLPFLLHRGYRTVCIVDRLSYMPEATIRVTDQPSDEEHVAVLNALRQFTRDTVSILDNEDFAALVLADERSVVGGLIAVSRWGASI